MIPKIIHQIWSGIDGPLPNPLRKLGETWKACHPDWQYEFWDNDRMNRFILDCYPQYREAYHRFTYNIQRWDAIRYLILDRMGGMYVDFDSECLEPLDELLEGKTCCFSMEPKSHWAMYNRKFFFNNALMASIPGHPFMKLVVRTVFENVKPVQFTGLKAKGDQVMESTGPTMLVNLYDSYLDKKSIYLIPYRYASPLSNKEIYYLRQGKYLNRLEKKMEKAYCIHYFFNTWLSTNDK
jgi:mannosyltransferase OCH1-like enzyme